VRSQFARGKGWDRWIKASGPVARPSPGDAVARENRGTRISTNARGFRFRSACVGITENPKAALGIMASDDVHRKLKFGPFHGASGERVLQRDGAMLPLGSRALDILIYLDRK